MPLVLINSTLIKENSRFTREYSKLKFGSNDRVSTGKVISLKCVKFNWRMRQCGLKFCVDGRLLGLTKYSLPSFPPLHLGFFGKPRNMLAPGDGESEILPFE